MLDRCLYFLARIAQWLKPVGSISWEIYVLFCPVNYILDIEFIERLRGALIFRSQPFLFSQLVDIIFPCFNRIIRGVDASSLPTWYRTSIFQSAHGYLCVLSWSLRRIILIVCLVSIFSSSHIRTTLGSQWRAFSWETSLADSFAASCVFALANYSFWRLSELLGLPSDWFTLISWVSSCRADGALTTSAFSAFKPVLRIISVGIRIFLSFDFGVSILRRIWTLRLQSSHTSLSSCSLPWRHYSRSSISQLTPSHQRRPSSSFSVIQWPLS